MSLRKLAYRSAFLCFAFCMTWTTYAQKVGLVFSGGGASGFAHVGVLKALEENDIPIDYITGTSAGALVGAMYASGYSPWEIEAIVTSEQFYLISQGLLGPEDRYYFSEVEESPELISYHFTKDSIFSKSLPTNLLNPTVLDLELLTYLGFNPVASKETFDSLFVPFRCVASNIADKSSVVFKDGELNKAVRASMTYPFFISPIEVEGELLFDGGLYNNFPATELYEDFSPDFIIGSNVSFNEAAPTDDNLISQIVNMFSSKSLYELPCEQGIMIEPNLGNISTFDFADIQKAIQIGYETTLENMDSIKAFVTRRQSKKELLTRRQTYNRKKISCRITNVNITGVTPDQESYLEQKFLPSKKSPTLTKDKLHFRYLDLYQNDHVVSIFPSLTNVTDTSQELNLAIKREKPLRLAFGGHYSSRPVNMGYLSASYSDFKRSPITFYANTFFGKFYGSVKAGLNFHLPTRANSYVEPVFVMNRWDYFRSFATFFEDVKPSYLVQNEIYWGLKAHFRVKQTGKLTVDFVNGTNEDDYYQTEDFTALDTTDFTSFHYYSPGVSLKFSNLNRKQFANEGMEANFESRFIHGVEHTLPGSTALLRDETKTFRTWVYFKANYTNYFIKRKHYSLGISAEGLYSFQPYFQNYTASILNSHVYEPIPDAKTGFYYDFRANKYLAGGLINVFSFFDNKLDVRLEAYYFKPIRRILNDNGIAVDGELFQGQFGIGSLSVIYHSVIGPIRGTMNYLDGKSPLERLSFQLSYGWVIFNKRGLR